MTALPTIVGATRGALAPGTQLSGIYEIEALIATGGMGEVYRAHAIETGDKVAIKMIRWEFATDDTFVALFRKEAAALYKLQHDAIIRYYISATDPVLHRPYLAMELIEGESLTEALRRAPLGFEAVLTLMERLASGLAIAHDLGIVHRDIAPDNVYLPDGDPSKAKIIDFGIARSAFGGDSVIGASFAGKLNFVSPEQVGLFEGQVSSRSDTYSLGLTLAAAAAGSPIDMGGTHVSMVQKRQTVPNLGAIDARLRPILARMLEPQPKDRPASMREIVTFAKQAMWERQGPTGVRASAAAALPVQAEAPRKRPVGMIVAAVAIVLALLGAGGFAWRAARPGEAARPLLDAAATAPVVAPAPTAVPVPAPRPEAGPAPMPRTAPVAAEPAPRPPAAPPAPVSDEPAPQVAHDLHPAPSAPGIEALRPSRPPPPVIALAPTVAPPPAAVAERDAPSATAPEPPTPVAAPSPSAVKEPAIPPAVPDAAAVVAQETTPPADLNDSPERLVEAPPPIVTPPPAPETLVAAPPPAPATTEPPPPAAVPAAPVVPAAPPAPAPQPAAVPQQAAAVAPVPAAGAPGPGSAFQDCPTCPQMVVVGGGAMRMGSNADPTERPIHRVTVKSFAMGVAPVTVAEWQRCVADKGCRFDPGGDPASPAQNLSFDDATEYVTWLSRHTAHAYRLPTEAEWEFAAHGGTTTRYWWGDKFEPDFSPCRTCGIPSETPPDPRRFPANPLGLFGVTGAVSQWVQDCWHRSYLKAPGDGSAWLSPACQQRVLRGGSWMSAPDALRLTNRDYYDGSVRYPGHGLRVARDL